MTNDKRFISGKSYIAEEARTMTYTEEEFFKELCKFPLIHFDEEGALDEGKCPVCSCGRGFINPKIPDLETLNGKMEMEMCKKRFIERLEKHIQSEIDIATNKIRNKYYKPIPPTSEESPTAS